MSQFGGLPEPSKDDKQDKLTPAGPTTNVISPSTASPQNPPEEPIEETLGQRRKRLQAQKQARDVSNVSSVQPDREAVERPAPSKRHSMASILSAHPTGPRLVSNERVVSNGITPLQSIPQPNTQRQTSWAMKVSAGADMALAAGVKNGEGGGPMDARKGDMIDRWRQSVLY